MNAMNTFLFGVYPYLCLAVFLLGSLVRFDRDQYTWKSDSSQMLRSGNLRWASNLFHAGVLFLLVGHAVGLLTPHWVYTPFITAGQKQLLAVVAGGIAGAACFVGLSGLIWRRIVEPRIRVTSHRTDLAVLLILWVQLALGLATLPFSLGHADGSVMLALSHWAQGILTFRPDPAAVASLDWAYRAHLVLGMTVFLLFPFTRLVHVWSGLAAVAYAFRPYQLVRARRLNLRASMRAGAGVDAAAWSAASSRPRVEPGLPTPGSVPSQPVLPASTTRAAVQPVSAKEIG